LNNKDEVDRLDKLIEKEGIETHTIYSVEKKKMIAHGKPTLVPTRGFGDFEVGHNKKFMTPEPQIKRTYFTYDENYHKRSVVIIGSDGLFGGINNKTAVSFVDCRLVEQLEGKYEKKRKRRLVRYYKHWKIPPLIKKVSKLKYNLLEICNELIDHCVARIPMYFEGLDYVKPIKTRDNVSVILISVHSPHSVKEMIGTKYKKNEYEDFDFHLISDSESDSEDENEEEEVSKKLIGANPGKRGIYRKGGVCWVIALLQTLIHIDKGGFVNLLSSPPTGKWKTVVTKIKKLSEKMWSEETKIDVLKDKETLELCQDVKGVVMHDITTDYGNSVKFLEQLFYYSENSLDFLATTQTIFYETVIKFKPNDDRFKISKQSVGGETIIPFSSVIQERDITFQEYFQFRETLVENYSMTDYSRSIFLKFPKYIFVKAGTELSGPRSFNSLIKDISEEIKIKTRFFDLSLELKAVVVKLPWHFYAYAKVGREWYTFDDDRVNAIQFKNIKYTKERFSVLVFENKKPTTSQINVDKLREELVAKNKTFLDIIQKKFEVIKAKHEDFYHLPNNKDIEISTEEELKNFSPLFLGFGRLVTLIIKSSIDLVTYPFNKIIKSVKDYEGFPRVEFDFANIPNVSIECRLFYPRKTKEDIIKQSLLKDYFSRIIDHKIGTYPYTICDFNILNIINRRRVLRVAPTLIPKEVVTISDVEQYLKRNNFFHKDLNEVLLLKSEGNFFVFDILLKKYYRNLRTLLRNLEQEKITIQMINVDFAVQYLLARKDEKEETLAAKYFIDYVNKIGKLFEKESENKFEHDINRFIKSNASTINGKKVNYSEMLFRHIYLANNNNYIKTIQIIQEKNKRYLKTFDKLFSVFKNFGVDKLTAASRCAIEVIQTNGILKKSIENMKTHILKILANNGYSVHVKLYEKLIYVFIGNYREILDYLVKGEDNFEELLNYVKTNEIELTIDELAKLVVLDVKRRGDGYKRVMSYLKSLVSEREPNLVTKDFIGKESQQRFTPKPYDVINTQYLKFDIYYQEDFDTTIKLIKDDVATFNTTKYESLKRDLLKGPPHSTRAKTEFIPFIIRINTTNIVYPKSENPKRENAKKFFRSRIKELEEEIPTKQEEGFFEVTDTKKKEELNEKKLALMHIPEYGDFYLMFSILPVLDGYNPLTQKPKFVIYINEFYFKDTNPGIDYIKGLGKNKTGHLKIIAIRSITHVLEKHFVQFYEIIPVPLKKNEFFQEAQEKKYTNPTNERLVRMRDSKKIESELNQAKSRYTIHKMFGKVSNKDRKKTIELSKEDEISTNEKKNIQEIRADEDFLREVADSVTKKELQKKKEEEEEEEEEEKRKIIEKIDKDLDETMKKYEEEISKDLEKQPLGFFGTIGDWISMEFGFPLIALEVPNEVRKKVDKAVSPSDKVFAYMKFRRSVRKYKPRFNDGLMLYHVIKKNTIIGEDEEIIKKLKYELIRNKGDYEKTRTLYKKLK
jgi:hypothetical protein